MSVPWAIHFDSIDHRMLSPEDDAALERAWDVARPRLEAAGESAEDVPEPYRTVLVVYSAQGVIDNGGLEYFFQSNWPGDPPYSVFSAAYRRIGSVEAADCLEAAVRCFPFEDPHLNLGGRRAYMKANYDKSRFGVTTWEDCICGDDEVWTNLVRYIRLYPTEFGLDA